MRETRCLSDTCDLFRGLDDNFIWHEAIVLTLGNKTR
jgi:hypothetical protein